MVYNTMWRNILKMLKNKTNMVSSDPIRNLGNIKHHLWSSSPSYGVYVPFAWELSWIRPVCHSSASFLLKCKVLHKKHQIKNLQVKYSGVKHLLLEWSRGNTAYVLGNRTHNWCGLKSSGSYFLLNIPLVATFVNQLKAAFTVMILLLLFPFEVCAFDGYVRNLLRHLWQKTLGRRCD